MKPNDLKPGDFVHFFSDLYEVPYVVVLKATVAPDVFRFIDPENTNSFDAGQPRHISDCEKVSRDEYEAWKLLNS